jgi:hypothetical protein
MMTPTARLLLQATLSRLPVLDFMPDVIHCNTGQYGCCLYT